MNLIKNIQSIAKEVLINESDALKKLSDYLDQDFDDCITAIHESAGKVVVAGIGKSAAIATKMVATLNSTGTRAVFMHAADAIHGDIGIVSADDVVIVISKSGNTPEIKVLIPFLKRRGVKIAGLVGNVDSVLAKQSDFVLNATVDKEACPNNLAPTTSTTAALALGDAIAVCLMEMKGFGEDDFAQSHPGGALGKRLYLRVSDIYPNNELPLAKADTPLEEVILEITSKRLGAVAIINDNQELEGIITDGDIRRMLSEGKDFKTLTASQIMGANPKTVEKEDYAAKAIKVMQENNITQIIVLDDKKVVGFVHLHDLLREGLI